MERRRFLKTGSIGVAAMLAGCGGGSGGNAGNSTTDGASGDAGTGGDTTGTIGTDTGADGGEATTDADATPATTEPRPANFSNVSLTGPANVTVGEDFALPVSVSNVGGENGTYRSNLTIAEGKATLNRSVEIAGVEPESTGQAEVGTLNFTNADTYTFTVEGSNTTHTVTVDPITKDLGESFTLDNGLAVTVREVSLQPAMFYTTEVNTGVFAEPTTVTRLKTASSDSVLVVLRLALENTGTGSVTFGPNALQVPQGSFYTQFESGIGLSAAKNSSATPLTGVEVASAERTQGWLLAEVPRSVATGTFGVRHQRDASGTPPEIRWTVPPKSGSTRSLPQFSLKTFETPKTAEVGRDNPVSVVVANEGKAAGRFRGLIQYRFSESEEWQSGSPNALSGDIKAGGTKRFEPTLKYPHTDILDFRLQPFDATRTVEFVPAIQSFGKSYTTPSGIEITVSDSQQSNTYEMTDDFDEEPTKSTAKNHFIFAKVRTEVVEQEVTGFYESDFVLVDGSETYEAVDFINNELASPVKGSVFSGSGDEQGAVVTGWIAFSVPQEYTADGAVIRWSNSDGAAAEWRSGGGGGGTQGTTNGSSSTTSR